MSAARGPVAQSRIRSHHVSSLRRRFLFWLDEMCLWPSGEACRLCQLAGRFEPSGLCHGPPFVRLTSPGLPFTFDVLDHSSLLKVRARACDAPLSIGFATRASQPTGCSLIVYTTAHSFVFSSATLLLPTLAKAN